MTDTLRKKIQLTDKEYQAIKQLFTLCERNDKHTPRLYWDCIKNRAKDVNHDYLFFKRDLLIAYLGIFNFNAKEVEICALVHPMHRRKGLFRQLIKAALADIHYKIIERVLLPCAKDFPPAGQALASLGAKYKHSEYTLHITQLPKLVIDKEPQAESVLTIRPIKPTDLPIVAKLDSECFKSPIEEGLTRFRQTSDQPGRQAYFAHLGETTIGKIHIHFFENKAFIHDFCIFPEHQGKKYGRDLLAATLHILQTQGCRIVELDVIASNEQAINLYLKTGFELKHAYDYWEALPGELKLSSGSSR